MLIVVRWRRLVEAEFAATGRWSLAGPVRSLARRTADALRFGEAISGRRSPHIRSTLGQASSDIRLLAGIRASSGWIPVPAVGRSSANPRTRRRDKLQHVANKTAAKAIHCFVFGSPITRLLTITRSAGDQTCPGCGHDYRGAGRDQCRRRVPDRREVWEVAVRRRAAETVPWPPGPAGVFHRL